MRHTHHLARDDLGTFSFGGIVRPHVNHPVLLPKVMSTFSLCVYSGHEEKAFECITVIMNSMRSKRLCLWLYLGLAYL